MLDQVEVSIRKDLQRRLKGVTLSPAQQKLFDAAPAKIAQLMRDEFNVEMLRATQIKVYQETFTQAEIDALVVFYRSPAGSAYIEKMPLVMQRTATELQDRFSPQFEKVATAVQAVVEEIESTK
jgi:hypothetical protein